MPLPSLARVGLSVVAIAVTSSTALTSSVYGADRVDRHRPSESTFAVIGDIPYGAEEIASFPKVVAQINADPAVSLVAHLGDIKNGSSTCDDAYFSMIRSRFDQFDDPFVYTIGDNEWTDCPRPNPRPAPDPGQGRRPYGVSGERPVLPRAHLLRRRAHRR